MMDSLVAEGMVRLRGGDEELDRAERLVREFEADNWTTEAPVAISDEDVLLRKGFLRNMQANQTDVNLHFLRDRGVVVVRGRQKHAESAATLLLSKLHGGGELDENGMPPCSVSLVAVAPSGMEVLTARGRLHLKRLSADTGTEMHVIPPASVVRIRARGRDPEAVAEATRALLRFVGGHRAEVFLDLAKVESDASPPARRSSSGGGGGGGGSEGKAGAEAMQEVVSGGGGGGGGVGRDGGVGASAADAKKAVRTPVSSVSNKIIRRTVKLHGCEAEFVAAPPPSPPVSSNTASGGRGGGNGNGNRRGGSGAGAERHRHGPHKSGPGRQDAGGRGAGVGATTTADDTHDDGSLSAVTGVSYTSSAPARRVMIRGLPGLVDKARDALVALVLGREDGEVALGEEAAAALGADSWRKIQDSSERVTITPDRSRCSLRVSGPPAAVEACRRELYTMLADAFRGEFVAVPIPREALHEVATPLRLADAAAAAAAATASSPRTGDGKRTAAAAGQIAEVLGPMGVAAAACGWRGEGNVQLLADWPCSCVRVRGEAAAVSVAVGEINTALSKWSALAVAAEVEEWMEPELFGKQRKAIKKLSQSMGGVVLNVVDGVCSGRAASEEEARDATRKLEERVSELRARRAVVRVPPEVVTRLTGRGGCSIDKIKERTRATIRIGEGVGGNEVIICGDPSAVAAARREVEAMARGPSKSSPAAQAPKDRQSPDGGVPDAAGDPSPLLPPSPGEGVPQTGTPSPLPPSPQNQNQLHAGNAAGGGGQDVDLADRRGGEATAGSVKTAEPAGSPPPAVVGGSNHPAKGSSASSYRGRLGERDTRVSAATESEAERLLASLLLVDNVAADVGRLSGRSHFSRRRREGAAATTGVGAGLRQPPPPPPFSGSGDTGGHRATPAATAAGGGLVVGSATPACNGSPPPSLLPVGGGVAPACGGGYFTSSSGIRVRL
ncbi:expressed unknown protein [Ectocarpus siliculosus]|uniref:K Homology domain-containing protein n=1 Tax=Ectocarpus siliculosus TaxID=2880 RepID=D7FTS7_ECTSI|nr:expressed unknown protein [Ectocarpus siliculosus]|eukprot:CBJ31454.1 expressed unknown protein [Ectocarpus siliculosus]